MTVATPPAILLLARFVTPDSGRDDAMMSAMRRQELTLPIRLLFGGGAIAAGVPSPLRRVGPNQNSERNSA